MKVSAGFSWFSCLCWKSESLKQWMTTPIFYNFLAQPLLLFPGVIWIIAKIKKKWNWKERQQWRDEMGGWRRRNKAWLADVETVKKWSTRINIFFLAYSSFHVSLYQKQKAVLIKSKKPSTASTTPTDDINRFLVKIPAFWGARWPRHKP